ncbi:MAG: MoaD/ThiS family protein [Thermoanaerobaculia bacterium]|nr:MoaD/ThiS family protein [Thermoanaerobaculia bacterium]
MKVEVLLFASLRDAVGRTIAVEVLQPVNVTTLRQALEAAHPVLARFGTRAKLAINETWAKETDPIAPGDTVALLPPIAGG